MTNILENSSVKISNDILLKIAGIAALETEGVGEIIGFNPYDLNPQKTKSSTHKSIKMDVEDGNITIQLSLFIKEGYKIPDVAQSTQSAIKSQIEMMTGLIVKKVDVLVEGVIN